MTEHDRFMAAEKADRVASDRQVSGRRVSTRIRTTNVCGEGPETIRAKRH